ncbi:hypothetical protein ACTQ33_01665 [Candidatus Avoscillospira sp. LCP25S3_F1]|uniref:hypothetical protein n=1 Tax=Candidatus Avoscillospira sp. LCP25S3_F1 TaxID=3438825 RepID=UPI003F8F26AE
MSHTSVMDKLLSVLLHNGTMAAFVVLFAGSAITMVFERKRLSAGRKKLLIALLCISAVYLIVVAVCMIGFASPGNPPVPVEP